MARPNKAAVRLCVGDMPKVNAENTVIASFIPNPAGVIEIIKPNDPIELINNASTKEMVKPKTPN